MSERRTAATLRRLVRITFPPVLQRHLRCPPLELDAPDLRALLDLAFARYEGLRGSSSAEPMARGSAR